jgi:hypothetical protein
MSNVDIDADVVIVGAGSAGVSAAVSAAESGARTVLIEASGEVGGTLAWQLLEHSAGFHDAAGNQVVGGFGQRLIDSLRERGSSPGHIRDDVGYTATRTPMNHAELAMAESVMLRDAGVSLLLNSRVTDAQVDAGRIDRVGAIGPDGTHTITGAVFVDTSGDAALAHVAGAEFQPDVLRQQPASLLFKIGNLDFVDLLAYAAANPRDFREGSVIGAALDEHVNLWGFGALLESAWSEGRLSLRRSELHLAGWPTRSEAIVNVTRTPVTGLSGADAGRAYLELQQQMLEFARWFRDSMPGGSDSYLSAVANRIGVRESRRVVGLETVTEHDVLAGARREDGIGRAAFPIDIHDATSSGLSHTDAVGTGYDIPYGALVVRGFENLLAAGRCVSSTHEANGSLRITATCFVTGEAAGVAGALAVRDRVALADVDLPALRVELDRRGVFGVSERIVSSTRARPTWTLDG